MAHLRLERLLHHVLPSVESASTEQFSVKSCPTAFPSSTTDDRSDWPHVLLLEPPAEDAMPKEDVHTLFAKYNLKVCWALEGLENAPKDAAALVTVKRKVDASVLDHFPKLRLVAVAFTGYDHVDLDLCKSRGIAVVNVPGYSTDSVAELCFGLILSLLRTIPRAHQHIRDGQWAWPSGNELSGKRLGLIGTGQIGMRVGEIGKAFRVSKILGFDLFKNPKFVELLGGEYVSSLVRLFMESDIVVVGCALTKETRGLVSAKLLSLLRPDSIIINCARGAIIDQEALTKGLQAKRFRAGLDVYEVEPLPATHPLRSIPDTQLITLPHLAYKCKEALRRRQEITLENILAFFTESPQNLVG